MRTAIIISGILHAAVVLLIVTKVSLFTPDPPESDVIPVDVVSEAELAEISTPKPAPEPKPEEEAPAPEPRPAAAPEPQPAPSVRRRADAVPPLDEIPEPESKPEAPPEKPEPRPTESVSPRTKPEPPSRFSTSRIAALIDKAEKAEKKPRTPQSRIDTAKLEEKLGASSLDQRRQLATIQDMMRTQIERCWSVPAGAENAENLVIRIRIELKPDGTLLSPPEIVNAGRMSGPNGDFFRVAAESARRAVQKCSPLKLPAESYQIWRTTELTFDPSKMLSVNQ